MSWESADDVICTRLCPCFLNDLFIQTEKKNILINNISDFEFPPIGEQTIQGPNSMKLQKYMFPLTLQESEMLYPSKFCKSCQFPTHFSFILSRLITSKSRSVLSWVYIKENRIWLWSKSSGVTWGTGRTGWMSLPLSSEGSFSVHWHLYRNSQRTD